MRTPTRLASVGWSDAGKGDLMHYNSCPKCGMEVLEHLSEHVLCGECVFKRDISPELRKWQTLESKKHCRLAKSDALVKNQSLEHFSVFARTIL